MGEQLLERGKKALDFNRPKAFRDFTEAIKNNVCQSEAYYHRGKIFAESEQFDAAIQDYSDALIIDTKSGDTFNNRGTVYLKMLNHEAAIQDFDKAIKCCDNLAGIAKTYLNRGKIYRDYFGDREQAIIDFGKAIEADKAYLAAFVERGITYLQEMQFDLAVGEFDKTLEIESKLSDAERDFYEAEKYNTEARERKQKVESAKKAFDEMVGKHKKELDDDPNDPANHYNLGVQPPFITPIGTQGFLLKLCLFSFRVLSKS